MNHTPSFLNPPSEEDPKWIHVPGVKRVYNRNILLAVLLISLAMSLIQVSSVDVILSALADGIGATQSQMQWVLAGYALAIGITLVPAGRLGDQIGRSIMFTIGLFLFSVMSVGCALSNDATVLNIFRIGQGMAAGFYSPQTTGLIQQYFQGQARARAFSMFGLVVGASVAFGPVLSGFLIEHFGHQTGWRLSFLINLPLGLIGVIASLRYLPFSKEREHFRRPKSAPREHVDLDPLGTVLLVGTVLSIMLPFIVKDEPWIWSLLPLAAILGFSWIKWEGLYERRGHAPMVNLSLFKLKSFSYCTGAAAIMFLGSASLFAVLAMYLQIGAGVPALPASMVGFPCAIISAFFAIWSGKYAIKRGPLLQLMALVIHAVGVALCIGIVWLVNDGYSFWLFSVPLLLVGVGQGTIGAVNQTHTMLDVPAEHGGTAGGFSQTSQRITTAIGNTITTAVFFGIIGHSKDLWQWSLGITGAFALIVVFLLSAAFVAFLYWRSFYKPRS
ncbi:MAG: MFS transporter [Actinomycetaceae bacterium]|nr:MFS transporter [Actinomycetaceae bacterium]